MGRRLVLDRYFSLFMLDLNLAVVLSVEEEDMRMCCDKRQLLSF